MRRWNQPKRKPPRCLPAEVFSCLSLPVLFFYISVAPRIRPIPAKCPFDDQRIGFTLDVHTDEARVLCFCACGISIRTWRDDCAGSSGGFDKSLEQTVAGMVHAHQQLLVPLNTNREPAGWNLDRLDNPVPGIGAWQHRRRGGGHGLGG